jgi:hypothetical protein
MDQSKRRKEGIMKEEITTGRLVIQELLAELIETTHLLTQQEGLMHLKTP